MLPSAAPKPTCSNDMETTPPNLKLASSNPAIPAPAQRRRLTDAMLSIMTEAGNRLDSDEPLLTKAEPRRGK